jgi:hypothetical protein
VQAAPGKAVGTTVGGTTATGANTGSAKLSVYSDCEAVLRQFDEKLFMAELVQVKAQYTFTILMTIRTG